MIDYDLNRSIIEDLQKELEKSILTPDFLELIEGETGINEERAHEIWKLAIKSGIIKSDKTILGRSYAKAIFELGLNESELKYIHGEDKEFNLLNDMEKVFAGYLISQIEMFEFWNDKLSERISDDKLVVRESKYQGNTVVLRLTNFIKPETFYAVSKIGDSVLLKEIEMKVK